MLAEQGSRLVRFGREHPALTVAGLAGAGLLGGIEVAAGVLLGAGVVALIRRPSRAATPEPRTEPRGPMRRTLDQLPHDLSDLKQRARAVMLAARGQNGPGPGADRGKPARPSEPGAVDESAV